VEEDVQRKWAMEPGQWGMSRRVARLSEMERKGLGLDVADCWRVGAEVKGVYEDQGGWVEM